MLKENTLAIIFSPGKSQVPKGKVGQMVRLDAVHGKEDNPQSQEVPCIYRTTAENRRSHKMSISCPTRCEGPKQLHTRKAACLEKDFVEEVTQISVGCEKVHLVMGFIVKFHAQIIVFYSHTQNF